MTVKVCGMREPNNITALAKLPIDLIGFIFYEKSPRFVGEDLMNWVQENGSVLEGVKRVGVTVNREIDEILNLTHDYTLDYVQLHGNESPEYCAEIISFWDASSVHRAELVKAFAIDEKFDFEQTKAYEPHCAFFVFDTKGDQKGGTGQKFNWDLLAQYQGETPFLLSGGIDPDSAEAIQKLQHPKMMGIDLNSKFETEPGIKNIDELKLFLYELGKR